MTQQIILPAGRLGRPGGGRLVAIGVLDVLAGVIALAWPGVTVLALAVVFGLFLLLGGLVALALGGLLRRGGLHPTPVFVVGAIAAVAGLVCLIHPGAGVVAIAIACAFWFGATGIGYLALARSSSSHRAVTGALGVLSVLCALALLASPGVAVVTIAWIAGIAFLVRGAGEILVGRRLRRALY